jgi:hypothetical protein
VDATHLSGRGATVLSRAVGRALDAGKDGGNNNWMTLKDPPTATQDETSPSLEYIDRSKQIIRGQ